MKFEGEISDLDLLPKLVELWREKFTGALRFESDGIIKIIYFRDGSVVSASTNDRTDSVDEILLRSGKITREHLRQALGKRKENETLGDALLSLGFITRKELVWARRVQLVGIIRSILAWSEGSYTIVSDYLPKREEGTLFFLPHILVELLVTEQDRARVTAALDDGNAVFRKSAGFNADYPALALNDEADSVVRLIDGWRTASQVAALSPADPFNTLKLMHALAVLGVIEPTKPQESLEVLPESVPEEAASDQAPIEYPPEPSPEPEMPVVDEPVAAGTGLLEMSDDELYQGGSGAERAGWESSWPAEDDEPAHAVASRASELSDYELPPIDPPYEPAGEEWQEASPAEADASAADALAIEDRIRQSRQKMARTRIVWGVVSAIVILAVLGGGAWMFLRKNPADLVPEINPASASKVGITPGRFPAVAATPAPAPAVQAGSTTELAPAPAPPIPFQGAPATTTSAAAPSTVTAAQPAPASLPPAVPAIPVTTATAGEEPSAPPAETATGAIPSAADASSSREQYDRMAQRYAETSAMTGFTVQFELVCQTESITKAIAAGGANVWFVPTTFRGGPCYRVFWGRYASREAAKAAIDKIPAGLRQGSVPTVVRPRGER